MINVVRLLKKMESLIIIFTLHLFKHHKCVLYLHSSRSANNSPPEIRATWSVLIPWKDVCGLSFVQMVVLGLMVTAWSTLRRQVVQMERPRAILAR